MSEKIKNLLGVSIIGALVVVALAVAVGVRAYSRSQQPSAYRSFSTSGEGKVIAVPDVADFSFTVVSEGGKDLTGLQTQNTVKINKIIEFIKSYEVDKEDIQTEGYNLNPRYSYVSCRADSVCPPPEIVGYTIRQTVGVKVRKFEDAGAILSGAIDKGANSVSQLNFRVDDPTKLQEEAREQAIAKAKEKAEAVARAGGFKLGRLLGIEENGYQPMPVYDYAYAKNEMSAGMGGSAVASPAPTIEPGSQEVKISVTLRYEIE